MAPDETRPSLEVVRADDALVDRLAAREDVPEDDDVARALRCWTTEIDTDLPADLTDDEPVTAPSRRTVLVTRAGVAASVAAVVTFGVSAAAAATDGGFDGFLHNVDRAVEQAVAAPRPADPAVLASAGAPTTDPGLDTTRKALALAQQRLAAGDDDGARAVVDLVQDQANRDPGALDGPGRALLTELRGRLAGGTVMADPPSAAPSSTGGARTSGTSTSAPSTSRGTHAPATGSVEASSPTHRPQRPTSDEGSRPATPQPSSTSGQAPTSAPTPVPTAPTGTSGSGTGQAPSSPTTVPSPTGSATTRPVTPGPVTSTGAPTSPGGTTTTTTTGTSTTGAGATSGAGSTGGTQARTERTASGGTGGTGGSTRSTRAHSGQRTDATRHATKKSTRHHR